MKYIYLFIENQMWVQKVLTMLGFELPDTLMGNMFIAEKVDYAEEYKKHLAGPNKDIPFSPQKGTIQRKCGLCFYREKTKNNPKMDCQVDSNLPKKLFLNNSKGFLPMTINEKEVGHYCRAWEDMRVE